MTITLENQNTINNILNIETPFNVNQIYTCRKGACQKIAYVSDSGINAKGKKENLIKLNISVVRVGVKYANLKVNEGKQLTGELPYGEWRDNGYIINHKDIEYLRVYNATLPNAKTKTYYLLNGEIKTKEWCRENNYLLSESDREKPSCYNIKVENIIQFGKGE